MIRVALAVLVLLGVGVTGAGAHGESLSDSWWRPGGGGRWTVELRLSAGDWDRLGGAGGAALVPPLRLSRRQVLCRGPVAPVSSAHAGRGMRRLTWEVRCPPGPGALEVDATPLLAALAGHVHVARFERAAGPPTDVVLTAAHPRSLVGDGPLPRSLSLAAALYRWLILAAPMLLRALRRSSPRPAALARVLALAAVAVAAGLLGPPVGATTADLFLALALGHLVALAPRRPSPRLSLLLTGALALTGTGLLRAVALSTGTALAWFGQIALVLALARCPASERLRAAVMVGWALWAGALSALL